MKKWSLDSLYKSFSSEDFLNDVAQIEVLVKESNEFAVKEFENTEFAAMKLKTFMNKQEELRNVFTRTMVFSRLTVTTDAMNEDARKYMAILQQLVRKH